MSLKLPLDDFSQIFKTIVIGMAEQVVYVNEQWHTGQLRSASYELATSGIKVLNHLIPKVEQLDPNLDWFDSTVHVRRLLVPGNVPETTTRSWDNNENWVFRFIASLPYLNTPGRIDRRLAERLQMFEYFRSPFEAYQYLVTAGKKFRRLRQGIEQGSANVFWVSIVTYEQSRLLRLALYEGDYFTRPLN